MSNEKTKPNVKNWGLIDDDLDFLQVNEPKMFYGASSIIFENAKKLRKTVTDAEKILWEHLKEKKLGVKFRRQHPISSFIADFYCHEKKLIIELDGSIHNIKEIFENDLERQAAIEAFGIKVIRFKNQEIYKT
jgi:cyclase